MIRTARIAAVACLLLPAIAGAQVATMDFSTIAHNDYDPLAQTFGDRAGLDVSNATRYGFGNASLNNCITGSSVFLWGPGYSDLSSAALACGNGSVGELSFTPTGGSQVTLQSLRLGSYSSSNGIGPARSINVQVFDATWTSVFSFVGVVSAGVDLFPNITSASTLYLQWGTDYNTGVNLVTTDLSNVTGGPVSTVPEPSTVALMACGLAALGGAARRRARLA